MSRQITPLEPGDVAEVGRFLAEGFGAAPDAEFVKPEIMMWKFFDPCGCDDAPRGYVSRVDDRVVGFVGLCPSTFHVAGRPDLAVPTLHMVDWLAEKGQANAGAYLFLRVHRGLATAYTLGASEDARRVVTGAGYELLRNVPVFVKTLRPSYRLREKGGTIRMARDLALTVLKPARRPKSVVRLQRVDNFGDEVNIILNECEPDVVFTRRRPDLLNHLLRYPAGTLTGYLIFRDEDLLGFALLSVIPQGRVKVGKVVECFLSRRNPDDWHAAMAALTAELKSRRADFAVACGSTNWAAQALQNAGFRERYRLGFRLRDKENALSHSLPFHITWVEADYAYLP